MREVSCPAAACATTRWASWVANFSLSSAPSPSTPGVGRARATRSSSRRSAPASKGEVRPSARRAPSAPAEAEGMVAARCAAGRSNVRACAPRFCLSAHPLAAWTAGRCGRDAASTRCPWSSRAERPSPFSASRRPRATAPTATGAPRSVFSGAFESRSSAPSRGARGAGAPLAVTATRSAGPAGTASPRWLSDTISTEPSGRTGAVWPG